MKMCQGERKQTVAGLEYSLACKLIFCWVKNGFINTREFMELLQCLPAFPPDLQTRRSDERTEFLKDVIVTAVEGGGLNHWAACKGYDYRKGLVYVKGRYDTARWQEVDLDIIDQGISMFRDPAFEIGPDYRVAIHFADTANDASYLEAITADFIIQAALFGEIMYD